MARRPGVVYQVLVHELDLIENALMLALARVADAYLLQCQEGEDDRYHAVDDVDADHVRERSEDERGS